MATTTTSYRKETLDVPGATLYYEVRGSGPVLLLMPGGILAQHPEGARRGL